jgi:Uma2 family endonuclease
VWSGRKVARWIAQKTGRDQVHPRGIAEFLNDQFRDQIKRRELPWTAKQMTVGVRSPRGRNWDTSRIPAVTVLPLAQWEAMSEREAVINLNELPPILVVEVVSPSTKTDDYRSKRSEYGLLEISEYWIVDPLEEKNYALRPGASVL